MQILVKFRDSIEEAIVSDVASDDYRRLENGEILFECFDNEERVVSTFPMSVIKNIGWNYDD